MLCKDCRKVKSNLTISEIISIWFMTHFFGETLHDLRSDSYTQGFSDGYKEGFSRSDEINRKEINNIIKLYHD